VSIVGLSCTLLGVLLGAAWWASRIYTTLNHIRERLDSNAEELIEWRKTHEREHERLWQDRDKMWTILLEMKARSGSGSANIPNPPAPLPPPKRSPDIHDCP